MKYYLHHNDEYQRTCQLELESFKEGMDLPDRAGLPIWRCQTAAPTSQYFCIPRALQQSHSVSTRVVGLDYITRPTTARKQNVRIVQTNTIKYKIKLLTLTKPLLACTVEGQQVEWGY